MTTISGITFLGRLLDAGLVPLGTRRVVIDAAIDDVVKVYIDSVGSTALTDDDIMDVLQGRNDMSRVDALKMVESWGDEE